MKLFQFNTNTVPKTTPKIASPLSLTNQLYSLFPKTFRDSAKVRANEFTPTVLKAKFESALSKNVPNINNARLARENTYKTIKQEIESLIPSEIRQKGDNQNILDSFARQYADNYIERRKIPFYETKEDLKRLGLAGTALSGLGALGYAGYHIKGLFGKKKKEGKDE